MRWGHGRWRDAMALLSAGALRDGEREAAESHAASCAECGEDLRALRESLAEVDADGVRESELPIPLGALVTRVQAEIDARLAAPAPRRHRLAWAGLGAATVAIAATMMMVMAGGRHQPAGPPAVTAEASPRVAVNDEGLRRMESALAREQAARYLSEAQDVLVTVAAQARPCDRSQRRVDVEDEARRSRDLLARRALLLDLQDPGVAPARPVLSDVEAALREVASLEGCARARDLEALNRDMERRRLLMKIELMTRELAG